MFTKIILKTTTILKKCVVSGSNKANEIDRNGHLKISFSNFWDGGDFSPAWRNQSWMKGKEEFFNANH